MQFEFKISNHGSNFSTRNFFWRCFEFEPLVDFNVIALIGGGTEPGFYGAVFEWNTHSQTPTSILAYVEFTGSDADQIVQLSTPITLHAGQKYLIGQGRGGGGSHYRVDQFDYVLMMTEHPVISWSPETNDSYRWGTDGHPSEIVGQEILDESSTIPRVGFVYEADISILQGNIIPSDAINDGAKWKRQGTSTWLPSGAEEFVLSEQTHTVEFKDITNWVTPDNIDVAISMGSRYTVEGEYKQTFIEVNISPSDAISDGAKWRLVGDTEWISSDEKRLVTDPGSRTIEFKDITGWKTPENIDFNISEGEHLVKSVQYKQTLLKVTISPSDAVSDGAQWRRQGTSTWMNSGDVESGIDGLDHTLEFKDLSKWTPPDNLEITLVEGELNEYEISYDQTSLTVNLEPSDAVNDGAKWRRQGTSTWYGSGEIEYGLQQKNHRIEFRNISKWVRPSSFDVTLNLNSHNEYSATYEQTSLKVEIFPNDVVENARWRRQGTTTWYQSGETEIGIDGTNHTIEFNNVPTWDKPDSFDVILTPAELNEYSGTYTQTSLKVNISPQDAVNDGARWRRQDTALWLNSGEEEFNIEPDEYIIEFRSLENWEKPSDKVVEVIHNIQNIFEGVYKQSTLKVNILPDNVIDDGAKWRIDIDPIEWYNSEEIIELRPGDYDIIFKSVEKWITPDKVSIELDPGQDRIITGEYERYGRLRVLIGPPSVLEYGPKWTYDAWNSENIHEEIVYLPPGYYTLQFGSINGYTTPHATTIYIPSDRLTEYTGFYNQSYVINKDPVHLHTMINYIVDYMCNIHVDDYCIGLPPDKRDMNTVINHILEYICDIKIEPNYINLPHYSDNLHNILDYLFGYVCSITLRQDNCMAIPPTSTLETTLQIISDYLCNITLKYNCLVDDGQSLHSVLNELSFILCNIELENHPFNISNPADLHTVLNGISKYLCNVRVAYDCLYAYERIYELSVDVVGEGYVLSTPAGINCPSLCEQSYVSSTVVDLDARAKDGWEFYTWEGPYVDEIGKFERARHEPLHNVISRLMNYLCHIHIYPTCFQLGMDESLHTVLNRIEEYVCVIHLYDNCMEIQNATNLHYILNAILEYICWIPLEVACFSGNIGDGGRSGYDFFNCRPVDSTVGGSAVTIYEIIQYLCEIPLDYNCVGSNEPATLHEILNAIIDYLCYFDFEGCFLPDWEFSLHEYFRRLDNYICDIPLVHCLDDNIPNPTTQPTAAPTTIHPTTNVHTSDPGMTTDPPDIYCDLPSYTGRQEIIHLSMGLYDGVTHITFKFDPINVPDRMLIYDGEVTPSEQEIEDGTDISQYTLLYDTGWRSQSPGSYSTSTYPGLQVCPPARSGLGEQYYCVNTQHWSSGRKTVVGWGKTSGTVWHIEDLECHEGTPLCPDDDPSSFR